MTKKAILSMAAIMFALAILAEGVGIPGSISGASNQETYDYRYIVELYDAGESENLSNEIGYFFAQYPESVFLPYLRYMEANLIMEQGNYPEAIARYEDLLDKPLSLDVMSVLILNYANCLYHTKYYAEALNALHRIDSEFPEPAVLVQVDNLRGNIYAEMGQYYSAERYYSLAWNAAPDDTEVRYKLYSTQLKLNMDVKALHMIDDVSLSSDYGILYATSWLQFMLNNYRYDEFDSFVQSRIPQEMTETPEIMELRIKRAFLAGDYGQAGGLLSSVSKPTDAINYFKGLLLVRQDEVATADSIFHSLVRQGSGEVAVAAYLERLKILYSEDSDAAIAQLSAYLSENPPEYLIAEAHYTLGHFIYSQGRYHEALKEFGYARQYSLFPELSSRIDFQIAEAWFQLDRSDMALESYNRYLNLYPQGSSADAALFRIGYLQFRNKDYPEARHALKRILSSHRESRYISDALYYMGEIEFFLANYNQALDYYHDLQEIEPSEETVKMRIAQSYYYLSNYDQAEAYIEDLGSGYQARILAGVIKFALKDYGTALDKFSMAEQSTDESLLQREARSYRALCLYQMKRYDEASLLYRELSDADENPDTYLFLSAKSAYAAQDYHQALELYDEFIDQYPDSRYYYNALVDIANAFYNMGNYEQAVEDHLNLLIQFRNNREFTPEELSIVRSSLLGIELGMKKIDNQELTDKLLMMPETFMSQFISFELNLMILKLYFDTEEWTELLDAAEEMRTKYPESKQQDVQMMMVSALINLEQYSQADSILSDAYRNSPTSEVLIRWAELEQLTGEYAAAIQKYQEAYAIDKRPQTWLAMLACSQSGGYLSFEEIWNMASSQEQQLAEAMVIKLNYLYDQGRHDEANIIADEIIAANLSSHVHATAFLTKGLIAFAGKDYPGSIALLKRVIVLFPEFPEIRSDAAYHVIHAYLLLGAKTEADTLTAVYQKYLSKEKMLELDKLRGEM